VAAVVRAQVLDHSSSPSRNDSDACQMRARCRSALAPLRSRRGRSSLGLCRFARVAATRPRRTRTSVRSAVCPMSQSGAARSSNVAWSSSPITAWESGSPASAARKPTVGRAGRFSREPRRSPSQRVRRGSIRYKTGVEGSSPPEAPHALGRPPQVPREESLLLRAEDWPPASPPLA
jgi:hypothetical protein